MRLDDYVREWRVPHADREVRLCNLPGVFAHGRLDRGTALLLDVLERLRPRGKVLDFACGSRVVGLALLAAIIKVERSPRWLTLKPMTRYSLHLYPKKE